MLSGCRSKRHVYENARGSAANYKGEDLCFSGLEKPSFTRRYPFCGSRWGRPPKGNRSSKRRKDDPASAAAYQNFGIVPFFVYFSDKESPEPEFLLKKLRLGGFLIVGEPFGVCGEFKKAFAIRLKKTPFDTMKARFANCTKVSKGGH